MKKRIIGICVIAIVVSCVAGVFGIRCVMYRPKRYDDLKPVQALGLFQDFSPDSGNCVYNVPPSVRSVVQPFLRPMQSWFGIINLSDEMKTELLHNYHWEKWSVSEEEWSNGEDAGNTIYYSHRFMFEFGELKKHYVNHSFLICRDFDLAQDQTHRIGQLFCYFDVNEQTISFYYTSS